MALKVMIMLFFKKELEPHSGTISLNLTWPCEMFPADGVKGFSRDDIL